MLAEIDEQFVGGVVVDQTRPRVLDVEHDVYDDDCEDCEAEDISYTEQSRHYRGSEGFLAASSLAHCCFFSSMSFADGGKRLKAFLMLLSAVFQILSGSL